jgi:ribonuclease D
VDEHLQLLRRLAWTPPAESSPSAIGAALRGLGARRWQVELIAQPIARAFLRLETQGEL